MMGAFERIAGVLSKRQVYPRKVAQLSNPLPRSQDEVYNF